MKPSRLSILALCAFFPLLALAGHGNEDGDHGKHHKHHKHHGEFKEEYWDGPCKVKRKLDKHGHYKEERKCKGAPPPVAYVPAPVVIPAPVVVEPGIVIQGTVRVK